MRTKKLTTDDRVREIFGKDEPQFQTIMELDRIEIILALNWYSQYKTKEDSHKYLAQYCKSAKLDATPQQIAAQVPTLGFVARMITRGAILDARSFKWFKGRLKDMLEIQPETVVSADSTPKPTPPKTTIQDRVKSAASKCIGALEGSVDEFILSDFKKVPNTLEVMREYEVKGPHCPHIVNFFKKWRDEFRIALTEKDPTYNEAYGNYSLQQMKKMEALYDQIISDALKLMSEAMAAKAPRKKKYKTPEQQVKKLKYLKEDRDLGIKSIDPTRIIGAEQIWVYHVPTRLLTNYVEDDAQGLSIKGSTVLNYSKEKSRSRKLRKPADTLPKVVEGGKVVLRNLLDTLTTKDGKVNGRINSQTVILRVIM